MRVAVGRSEGCGDAGTTNSLPDPQGRILVSEFRCSCSLRPATAGDGGLCRSEHPDQRAVEEALLLARRPPITAPTAALEMIATSSVVAHMGPDSGSLWDGASLTCRSARP